MYSALHDDTMAQIETKVVTTRRRRSQDFLYPWSETAKRANAMRFLTSAKLPVLAVFGDRGRPHPGPEMLAVPERSNIDLVWIERAGHYLPHEAPAAIRWAISAWLAQLDLTPELAQIDGRSPSEAPVIRLEPVGASVGLPTSCVFRTMIIRAACTASQPSDRVSHTVAAGSGAGWSGVSQDSLPPAYSIASCRGLFHSCMV